MSSLLDMLKTQSFERRTVTLASGKTSDFYIDCKKTFLWQDGLVQSAVALIHILRNNVIAGNWGVCSFVASTGLGGGPLASAMVVESHHMGNKLDMLYVRKEAKGHGTEQRIEGGPFIAKEAYDKGVVVVDDVVTSGGTALMVCRTLKEAGYQVQGVVALVDREEGGREKLMEHGFLLDSVFTKADFMEET